MTLRLRRGTDLERQSVVFQEGELVYITDTQDLYAGDGATPGGIKVSNVGSPNALTQNLNLNGFNISGNGIITATSFVGDGSGLTNLPTGGLIPGDTYEIGVRGDVISQDNTLLVDSVNKLVYGTFIGDGTGLTGISGVTPGEEYLISIQGNVRGFDSSILVDSALNLFNGTLKGSAIGFDDSVLINASTNTHYGAFVGDGSGLTNLGAALTDPLYGINVQGNLFATDNSLIVDANTKTVYGTFIGDGSLLQNLNLNINPNDEYTINIQGSVRGFDSSIIIDPSSNSLYGNFSGDGSLITGITLSQLDDINIVNPQIGQQLFFNGITWQNSTVDNITEGETYKINIAAFDSSLILDASTGTYTGDVISNNTTLSRVTSTIGNIDLFNTDDTLDLNFVRESAADLSLDNSDRGKIFFSRNDINGNAIETIVGGGRGGFYVSMDDGTTTFPQAGTLIFTKEGKLGIGTYTPGHTLDVAGGVSATGYVQFGSYTTTARNLLTAANGMVIYNSTSNRFQGYQNGAWINLDDGTAAP